MVSDTTRPECLQVYPLAQRTDATGARTVVVVMVAIKPGTRHHVTGASPFTPYFEQGDDAGDDRHGGDPDSTDQHRWLEVVR